MSDIEEAAIAVCRLKCKGAFRINYYKNGSVGLRHVRKHWNKKHSSGYPLVGTYAS